MIDFNGHRDLFETLGQTCEMRPPASEGRAKRAETFLSRPLDWRKMHFRALPTVKMLKILNYEVP